MANQGMMVPPNNAPWPGLQAPSHSHSHSHSAHSAHSAHSSHGHNQPPPPPPHSSTYPPPHYYHHPGHPHPPPPPSSHQQPYYPYHSYPAAPYPPHYSHPSHLSHPPPTHPAYHHAPPHYPPASNHLQPPAALDTVSSSASNSSTPSSPSISPTTFNQPATPATAAGSTKPAASNATAKSIKVLKTNNGKAEASKDSKTPSGGSKTSSSSTAPKTFRFEGSISSETYKTTKSFDLAGVNILNRKPLDTRTALDKLQRRRETHNRVERKRRDCINQLIDDLTSLLPPKHLEEVTSKCHRVNVLRGAVAHIKFLSETSAVLSSTLENAKEQGYSVPAELAARQQLSISIDNAEAEAEAGAPSASASFEEDSMSMDVDAVDTVKQENNDDDENDEDQVARTEKTSSRSSSPSAFSSSSRSASPRMTSFKALSRLPIIVTNAPTPSSKKQSKSVLAPPPISIITAPADQYSLKSHSQRSNSISDSASPASSFSASPMFPSSPYMSSSSPLSSTSPPSPLSISPSARHNPFSLKVSQAEGQQSSGKEQQQLSPFEKHPSKSPSPSPSLPPISSLAIQSPSGHMGSSSFSERRPSDRPLSPSLRSSADRHSNASSTPSNGKYGSHRSGPILPPLKIPGQQHLHPSYSQASNAGKNDPSKGGHRSSQTLSPHQSSTSPRHHRSGDDQPPVSPFMLSPMISRSPSMGPLSSSSPATSPYPHWGHEGSDVPPPHPSHYMPGSLSPHAYPHGYPYPYPYHPSYGYPHPHGPPQHHHPHHQHPPPHSPQHQPTSPQPTPVRSLQPEPIFIQEEPWIVQRKRSSSNVSSKNQSSATSSSKQSSKKSQENEEDQLAGEAPVSPSTSVTSSTSYPASPNLRKRPSHKGSYDDGEDVVAKSFSSSPKRVKQQQQTLSADLENGDGEAVTHRSRQRDSGIVVVVVEADSDMSLVAAESKSLAIENGDRTSDFEETTKQVNNKEVEMSPQEQTKQAKAAENDADAAQALTTLAQNAA